MVGPTVRLRGGGHVAPLRAEALPGAPPPPGRPPRYRRSAVPAVTLRRCPRLPVRAWPVLRAGHPLAAQDHSQGRSLRSRRQGDGRKRPPLSSDLARQDLGTYRKDGAKRGGPADQAGAHGQPGSPDTRDQRICNSMSGRMDPNRSSKLSYADIPPLDSAYRANIDSQRSV